MEVATDFLNWLQQTLGPAAYAGMRLGLIVGPISGILIWPFFGQNSDRVISWGLAGLIGGGFIGAIVRLTTALTGMRLMFANQPDSGAELFLQFAYAVGLGALLGVIGVILVTELQRAAIGAFAGALVGIVLGILTTFILNFLPPMPSLWDPFLVGAAVVAGVALAAVLLEDMF